MALANNDLLIIQKPTSLQHFKVKVGDLPYGDAIPDGTQEGDYLRWSGTDWVPSNEIDGGEYAT